MLIVKPALHVCVAAHMQHQRRDSHLRNKNCSKESSSPTYRSHVVDYNLSIKPNFQKHLSSAGLGSPYNLVTRGHRHEPSTSHGTMSVRKIKIRMKFSKAE